MSVATSNQMREEIPELIWKIILKILFLYEHFLSTNFVLGVSREAESAIIKRFCYNKEMYYLKSGSHNYGGWQVQHPKSVVWASSLETPDS